MVQFQSPAFCSRCSYLALAKLDGAELCLSCVLRVLKTTEDPYLIYRIRPLDLENTRIRGLAKTKPIGQRGQSLTLEAILGAG